MARTVTGTLTVNAATVTYTLTLPRGCSDTTNGAAGRRAILTAHGHGGDSKSFASQGGAMADHPRAWADRGYVVGCIDNGTEWFDDDAIARQNALRTRLVSVLGCTPRVGLSGMSMGGGTALAYLLLNPTLVACAFVFAPALDLRWLGSAAGYTPPYSTDSLTPSATWASELSTDYPSGYTSHDPMQNIAAYRNLAPVKVTHATDDTLLPYDSSRYFVAQVNDPEVTFRTPDVTGGHSTLFISNVPTAETLAFFDNNWT